MDPNVYESLRSTEADAAALHYGRALELLGARRWEEAMGAFEMAFARDADGVLDRRPCFDWFRSLQIDEISDFWLAELTRFFRRYDIDKTHYAMAGVQALGAKAEFRALIAGDATNAQLDAVMRSELFGLLLRETIVGKSTFEVALVRLRARLLLDAGLRERAPLDFLCDLALQCFNNEHVYAETPEEAARAAALVLEVTERLRRPDTGTDALPRAIATLCAYRRLAEVCGLRSIVKLPSAAMDRLLRRVIGMGLEERRLRDTLHTFAPIVDPTSLRVREQYEEHPYPRWFQLDRPARVPLREWAVAEIPDTHAMPEEAGMLVAGCGTGVETLNLAARVAGLRITAIDLSRASLAYALRKTNRRGMGGVRFLHGDILALDALNETFDFVYSTGVLHHLADPRAGLRALLGRLRPGGWLKLGLYSERARGAIVDARREIAAQGLAGTPDGIREFRRQVLHSPPDSPLRRLLRYRDFFTMSECRDLLFHVQERSYRLPEIRQLLRNEGLTVLGLSRRQPPAALAAYRKMYPDDAAARDLARWDAVEAKNPEIFEGMYHIWAKKPA